MSKASTTSSALRLSYSNLHKLKTSQSPKSKLIVSKMQINHASLNSRQKFCFFSLSFLMVIFPFYIHSAKFKKLINCVIKTVEICVGNVLPESWIENLVHGNFKENTTAGGRFHLCYRWTTYVTARSSLLQTTVRGISIKNSTQTSRIPNCARKSKHWTNTVKPRFTDIRLIPTVFFVPGEKKPPHFF